ncbi:MAG: hypothetical protein OEN02_13750 [Gammaproteobacteria bacterium]|nr:hypothetical protein [Gammaproteobacteria bacterium]MDH3535214.1 hypothetical protein [Gammaproteobacteria bacterium]
MVTLQSFFLALVAGILVYLIADGVLTGSVWIKGARTGIVNFRKWAHKRGRDDEPFSYWFTMAFYSMALLLIVWLLVSG